MKRISCGDLIPGCGFKAQAASDAEVLAVEMDHVRGAHGLEVTPAFIKRARERIEDVEQAGEARGVRREAARRG